MVHRQVTLLVIMLATTLPLGAVGCNEAPSQAGAFPKLKVVAFQPIARSVTDYNTFTSRTAAVKTVQIRARVTGYLLDHFNFQEGDRVKEKQVLCEIDPRPYKAVYDQAVANAAQTKAHLERLGRDYERERALFAKGAVSQEDYDKYAGDLKEAQATNNSASAAVAAAKLNLDFTKVRSPVTGKISRRMVDPGNLVKADDTILTNVVTEDPIWAYFDVDDQTFMRVNKRLKEATGGLASLPDVEMRVTGETAWPHQGKINFVDNQVDAGTGTMRMRGVFPNKDGKLVPGLFGRVRVPLGEPHEAFLVPDRAVDTDQGQKVLYLVSRDNKVEKRPVELAGLHDGLREISRGIKRGDRVIVEELQRVRPGMDVEVAQKK